MRRNFRIRKIQVGQDQQQAADVFSQTIARNTVEANVVASEFELANRQRPRSAEIMEAIRNLDMTADESYRAELLDWLQQAYQERMGGMLLGYLGRCYLGRPYIDHMLDLVGRIVQHYTPEQTPPDLFAKARPYVASKRYEFVEIYSDGAIVPIGPDGSAH